MMTITFYDTHIFSLRKFVVSLSEDDDIQFTCVDVYFYISSHGQTCY